MPTINSFTATTTAVVAGRYAAGYEIKTADGSLGTSEDLTFTAVSTSTESTNRLYIFIVGIDFNSSGSISSLSYGGNYCTRVIASASTSDRSSVEIWSVVLATNPSTDVLTVNTGNNMSKLSVAREVILGMSDTAAYDTDVVKRNSDQAVDVTIDHPANGVTLLGSVLWWGGSSAANATWPVGGATKAGQGFGSSGDEFGMSSAYYTNTAVDSNRNFGTNWTGPGSPNQEVCGASWR